MTGQEPRNTGLRQVARRHRWVVAACALLMLPALQDIPWLRDVSSRYENTIDAGFAVLGVLIVAGLIQRWSTDIQLERDAQRYQHVSKLVFRGLSQAINDAHRIQLAPLAGVDLESFGIPAPKHEVMRAWREELKRSGKKSLPLPSTGFWQDTYRPVAEERLKECISSSLFVEAMYVSTTFARRLLQTAFTDAAAIAQAVPAAAEQLSSVASVADDIVEAQEQWRRALVKSPVETAALVTAYLKSIDSTYSVLMSFQNSVDLPAGRVDVPAQRHSSVRV